MFYYPENLHIEVLLVACAYLWMSLSGFLYSLLLLIGIFYIQRFALFWQYSKEMLTLFFTTISVCLVFFYFNSICFFVFTVFYTTWFMPFIYIHALGGYWVSFGIDSVSSSFCVLTSVIWCTTVVYEISTWLYISTMNRLFVYKALSLDPIKSDLFLLILSFRNMLIRLLLLTITCLVIFLLFLTHDVLLFYILFEFSAVPLFIYILLQGSRTSKSRAAYYLFYYTFVSALIFLFAIVILVAYYGSTEYSYLFVHEQVISVEFIIYVCMVVPFLIKVPMVPLHSWLPEAHVEAPTTGSVLLAGLILKLGLYGIIRFLLPLFPTAHGILAYVLFILTLLSMIYTSLAIFRNTDLKKIVAYSSIAHMNFAFLGLLTQSLTGYVGCLMLMYVHCFSASGLFFVIGMLYQRFHTRVLHYYSGLATFYPMLAVFAFIFTLSSIGFPLTGGFIAEFFIIVALVNYNLFLCAVAMIGPLLSTVYSLLLFTRIFFGVSFLKIFLIRVFPLRPKINVVKVRNNAAEKSSTYKILTRNQQACITRPALLLRYEFFILMFLSMHIFLLGCFPQLWVIGFSSTFVG